MGVVYLQLLFTNLISSNVLINTHTQYTSRKIFDRSRILLLPGLDMGNVQGITQALHVGPEYEVIWPKQGLDSIAHLVTNLEKQYIVVR